MGQLGKFCPLIDEMDKCRGGKHTNIVSISIQGKVKGT